MDTQAFQHRLSLFPQLTLRQRRLAHHELSPLIPSLRLPLIYRIAAIAPLSGSGRGRSIITLGVALRVTSLSLQAMPAHQFSSNQDAHGQIA